MATEICPTAIEGQEGFLDEHAVLKRIPVSRKTLYNWRLTGKVPFIKIGKRNLFFWPSVQGALLRMQKGVA